MKENKKRGEIHELIQELLGPNYVCMLQPNKNLWKIVIIKINKLIIHNNLYLNYTIRY